MYGEVALVFSNLRFFGISLDKEKRRGKRTYNICQQIKTEVGLFFPIRTEFDK